MEKDKLNLVLIGLRGSGKTTVGRLLAKKLKRRLIEMDELIVKKAGLSIPEIVQKFGWEKFRDLEEIVAKEVASLEKVVIATGGGVVTRKSNIVNLKKKGVIIWLQAKIETLLKRIGEDKNRPSLTGEKSKRQEMEVIFNQRKRLYKKAADLAVDTEGKKPYQVAEEIKKIISQHPSWGEKQK